jgi:hypothetical protein
LLLSMFWHYINALWHFKWFIWFRQCFKYYGQTEVIVTILIQYWHQFIIPAKYWLCSHLVSVICSYFIFLLYVISPWWSYWMLHQTINQISWWLVLLEEETGVLGENHRLVAIHGQTLWHNVVRSTPHQEPDSNSQL